jgi:hypothetical protein
MTADPENARLRTLLRRLHSMLAARDPVVFSQELGFIEAELQGQNGAVGFTAETDGVDARRTAEYWKAEHLAGNAVISKLREELREIADSDPGLNASSLRAMARQGLVELPPETKATYPRGFSPQEVSECLEAFMKKWLAQKASEPQCICATTAEPLRLVDPQCPKHSTRG